MYQIFTNKTNSVKGSYQFDVVNSETGHLICTHYTNDADLYDDVHDLNNGDPSTLYGFDNVAQAAKYIIDRA